MKINMGLMGRLAIFATAIIWGTSFVVLKNTLDSMGTMWLDSNGRITKSKWIKDDAGEWYYLKANGYLAVNEWVKDSAGWLYVDGNGMILREAWANDSLGTLWMDSNGRITKSQWLYLDDGTYYVDANGYMVTGSQFIDGAWWTFFDDGKLNAKG
jgi:glucan-binding YG repeat protein